EIVPHRHDSVSITVEERAAALSGNAQRATQMFQDYSPAQRRGFKDVKAAERLRQCVERGQRLAARQQQCVLNAQRMQIPQQQRRLLSRRKIEVNRGPVESSFESFFRRLVKAQEFSEQPSVIVEGVHAVKKI